MTRKTLEKLGLRPNGRWLIQHAGCAIKYRGTNHSYVRPVEICEIKEVEEGE
ncbi:hypothetical protein GL4_0614 [Methyloceanibacter caenitepidi]|uniref:Uncharacterized protein n=1 Tax=Methyloceanibacter caenitepidi TaxID=1384459 RepID=A0A0A8K0P5_9HYPH|nr:hypothetical protein GL4_0614 [Methyloceanibacter caenitepidi]